MLTKSMSMGATTPKRTTPAPQYQTDFVASILGLTGLAVIAVAIGLGVSSDPSTESEAAADPSRSTPAVLLSSPLVKREGYSYAPLLPTSGAWSGSINYTQRLSDHGVVEYDGYLYLFGGLLDGVPSAALIRIDPYESGSSLVLTPMLEPRYRFGYAQLTGRLYVLGGLSSTASDAAPKATNMVYDFRSNTWAAATGGLATGRHSLCAAALGNQIYALGGYDAAGTAQSRVEAQVPDSPAWYQVADMAQARGACAAVAAGALLYALGGRALDGTYLQSVEALNASTRGTAEWSYVANMTSPRAAFAATYSTHAGVILVAGGQSSSTSGARWLGLRGVEEYVVADDVWVVKAPLLAPWMRCAGALADGSFWVSGGVSSCSAASAPSGPCNGTAQGGAMGFVDTPAAGWLYVEVPQQ